MHKSQLVSPKKIKMHLVRKYFEHFVFPPITPALKASTYKPNKSFKVAVSLPPLHLWLPGIHNTLFNFVCRYDASKHELMFLSSNGIYKTLEYTESLPPYHPASLALQMDVKCQKNTFLQPKAQCCVLYILVSISHLHSTPHHPSNIFTEPLNFQKPDQNCSTESVSCSLTSWFELKSRVLNKM